MSETACDGNGSLREEQLDSEIEPPIKVQGTVIFSQEMCVRACVRACVCACVRAYRTCARTRWREGESTRESEHLRLKAGLPRGREMAMIFSGDILKSNRDQ